MLAPDNEQQLILASKDRFNAIDGNAGAAKTTTLAMKVQHALRRGMLAEDVLVLTYSPAAVLAFQQRLRWLGVERERIARVHITTFDTLCHERLQALQGGCAYLEYPNRLVFETVQRAIQEARLRIDRRGMSHAFTIAGEGTLFIPTLLHAFRHLKGTMAVRSLGNEFILTPASASEAGLDFTETAVLQAYEALRCPSAEEPGAFRDSLGPLFRLPDDGFYDMACVLTADDPIYAYESHPLKLDARLVLIDEGHDINRAMFTVLQNLVEVNPVEQLFVVGDRDQVVHSDGGADAGFMKEHFEVGIGKLRRIELTTCRRFGRSLAQPLSDHAAKAYAFESDRETKVVVARARSASAIATLIEGAFNQTGSSPDRRPGLAVLLRHPGASVDLEIALTKKGFRIETNGFRPFLERPEVQFLRTLVAWVTGSLDTLARSDLLAIQEALAEFTGCRAHKETSQVRHSNWEHFRDYFLGNPADLLSGVRDPTVVMSRAEDDARETLRHFIGSFAVGVETDGLHGLLLDAGLVRMLKRAFVYDEQVVDALAAMTSFARTAAAFATFNNWLKGMAAQEWAAKSASRANQRLIRLYAIPAAKGLEFDHVVLPDVDATTFDGSEQEERNLFYVGASRARHLLTMSYRDQPSSYLQSFAAGATWEEVLEPQYAAGGG